MKLEEYSMDQLIVYQEMNGPKKDLSTLPVSTTDVYYDHSVAKPFSLGFSF